MAARIHVLKQRRHDLLQEWAAIDQAAAAEDNRPTNPEERARIQEIEAQIATLDEDILAEERRLAAEAAIPAVRTLQTDHGPQVSGMHVRLEDDPRRGFGTLGEFALAVRAACYPGGVVDDRLRYVAAPSNYLQESGGTAGEGYNVPPQFRQEIFELIFADENILSLVDREDTTGNTVQLDADETTPWGSSGIQAKWRAEASQMTATKLVTEHRQVRLHELYAFVTATDELLQDAPRLNNRLLRKSPQAIAWKADEAIVNGTGAGQPLGWFTSGALVSVAKESGQAADSLVAANVAKMYARQLNPGRAIWFISQDVLPQLVTMTLGNQPIWTPPATGIVGAPGGFLFGRPIRFSQHCQTLGDKGDIQFVDPMGYYATTKAAGMQFASSMHLYFDFGMTAFRWTFRLGGQPYLEAPVSQAKSADTLSHFVTLDARA